MTTVHAAWNEVMADVRAISKSERNKFQNYNFRGIDAVMNAVGPALRDKGVSVIPEEIVNVRFREDIPTAKGGVQQEAIITVRYRVYGPEGDSFTGSSIGQAADSSDKAVPQAMSVAYRTFLLQALTMPTDDPDPDGHTIERQAVEEPAPDSYAEDGWASPTERSEVWAELLSELKAMPDGDDKDNLRRFVKSFGITGSTLTLEQSTKILSTLWSEAGDGDDRERDWGSAAERTRTHAGLMERLGKLSAEAAEDIQASFSDEALSADFTKADSILLLSAIEKAEQGVKE